MTALFFFGEGNRQCQVRAVSINPRHLFVGVGTVFCAFAPSMESLIAARAIAGIGGGGLTSVGSIIISDLGEIVEQICLDVSLTMHY